MNLRKAVLSFGIVLSLSSQAHGATVSLLDKFDDGNIATNTGPGGIGSGFTTSYIDCLTGAGVTSSEASGIATIGGASCVHWMQSNDAIDPTGTTMIWSLEKTTEDALLGWVQAGKDACCEPGIYLTIRPNGVFFDLVSYQTTPGFQWQGRYLAIPAGSTAAGAVYPGYPIYSPGSGPMTATVSISASGWAVSIHGSGVDIEQSGSYSSCLYPVGGQCITLSDVMSSPGVNGTLRPVAGGGRENQSIQYSTVVVISD
ncbi:MAG TPA: hypothetical protein VN851_26905 [Thermoanaerobaculia bacterium]|nr:hypothetical protein [Thermoanaerobaculia bacterium]